MTLDFQSPARTAEYVALLEHVVAMQVAQAKLFAGYTDLANIPTDAIRWNPTAGRMEGFASGLAWDVLCAKLMMNVDQLDGLHAADLALVGHNHSGLYQPGDPELTAIAGLTSAADQGFFFTGPGAADTFLLTSYFRSLGSCGNALAVQMALCLLPGTNVQAYHANLAALANTAAAILGVLASPDVPTMRTNMGLNARSSQTLTPDTICYIDHAGAPQQLALGAANTVLTSGGATSAPTFAAGSAIATAIAVFDSFLNQIDLGRSSGAIPSGYMHLFLSDELATKANATYDAAGDYYGNGGSYGSDLTSTSYAITSGNFDATNTSDKAFDNNGTTKWGSSDGPALGTVYIGQNFGAGNEKHIRRIMLTQVATNYVTSVKVQRSSDGSSWTDVSTHTVAAGGNTIDLAVSAAYRYWRLLNNSTVSGGGGSGISLAWGVYEIEMIELLATTNMTLIPTAITAGAAPSTVDLYLLHKAVDAVTLNTDLKARVSRDNGSNWSSFVTLAEVCQYDANYKLLRGTADLSALASGTSVKWEITTLNTKQQRVRATGMLLNS